MLLIFSSHLVLIYMYYINLEEIYVSKGIFDGFLFVLRFVCFLRKKYFQETMAIALSFYMPCKIVFRYTLNFRQVLELLYIKAFM